MKMVKIIATLTIAEMLFKHDDKLFFKHHDKAFKFLKDQTAITMYKLSRLEKKKYPLAVMLAEAVILQGNRYAKEHNIEFSPTMCGLALLSDMEDDISEMPRIMKLNYDAINELSDELSESEGMTLELSKGSAKLDKKMSELLQAVVSAKKILKQKKG